MRCLTLAVVVFAAAEASADAPLAAPSEASAAAWSRFGDFDHGASFEVDVLLPIFGLEDLRFMLPLLRPQKRDWRGELVVGLSTDYAFGPLSRPVDQYGKVFIITGRVGWRQFLAYGFHVEVAVNLGERHEAYNIHDNAPSLDGGYGRVWIFAGWQLDITSRFYANVRGDVGILLFRTDRFAQYEKQIVPAAELNLGLRF